MALDAFTSFALLVWDAKVATEKWVPLLKATWLKIWKYGMETN